MITGENTQFAFLMEQSDWCGEQDYPTSMVTNVSLYGSLQ